MGYSGDIVVECRESREHYPPVVGRKMGGGMMELFPIVR